MKDKIILILLVCFGFYTNMLNAQVTQASKLMAQYEDVFFSKIETISDDYKKDMDTVNILYLETLQKYMHVMQSRGSLYEVNAAKTEINRFSEDKTLMSKDVNSEFETLKKIQLAFIDKMDEINFKRSSDIVDLYSKIIPALNKYKEQLTQEGNLNDAQWVDEKQKEFENSRFLKQAKTSVKMYEITHKTNQIEEEETKTTNEQPQIDNNSTIPPQDTDVLSETAIDPAIHGAIKIHHDKTVPHGHTREEYKRFSLSSRTDLNSSALSIISYLRDLDNDEKGTYPWAKKFRFQINSLTSKTDYNDCFIVIQYFGSVKTTRRQSDIYAINQSTVSTRTSVSNLGFQIVQIPAPLTNSRLFLDMPAFPEIESEPWNTTSYQASMDFNRFDFFGIIVSIFDADNNLIYQKASNDGLKPIARSTPPINTRHIRNPENFSISPAPLN